MRTASPRGTPFSRMMEGIMFTWALSSLLAIGLIVPVSHETTIARAAKTSVWVGIRLHVVPSDALKELTAESEDPAKETIEEEVGLCSGFVISDKQADVQAGWRTNQPDTMLIVTAKHCTT